MLLIILIIVGCTGINIENSKGKGRARGIFDQQEDVITRFKKSIGSCVTLFNNGVSYWQIGELIDRQKQYIAISSKNRCEIDKKVLSMIQKNYNSIYYDHIEFLFYHCLFSGLIESSRFLMNKYLEKIKDPAALLIKNENQEYYMILAANLDLELLRLMLLSGFNVNSLYKQKRPLDERSKYQKIYRRSLSKIDKSTNILMYAARENKLDIANLVLEYNIDMNQKDEFNETALDIAITRKNVDISKVIIDKYISHRGFIFNWTKLFTNNIELSEYFMQKYIDMFKNRIRYLKTIKDLNETEDKEVKKWITIAKTCLVDINLESNLLELYLELIQLIIEHNSISYSLITNVEDYPSNLMAIGRSMVDLPIELIQLIMSFKGYKYKPKE